MLYFFYWLIYILYYTLKSGENVLLCYGSSLSKSHIDYTLR